MNDKGKEICAWKNCTDVNWKEQEVCPGSFLIGAYGGGVVDGLPAIINFGFISVTYD